MKRVWLALTLPFLTLAAAGKFEDPTQAEFGKLQDVGAPEIVTLREGESYTLRARIVKQAVGGKTFRRFAYNGSIPGPTFKLKQGAKATIKLVNETGMETSLHSHGLRLDYRFDGAVGLGQKAAVKPGESFDYQLVFPDAGIFWYHPHVREDLQQDMGLMGNFIVEPSAGSFWNKVDREMPLMLDDMLAKVPLPYPLDAANHALMGRFGDTYLLNGRETPDLEARPGEIVRYFLTNSANTRTFRIRFAGAKTKLVGSDLSPFEREEMVDTVTIAPGERYVVEVLFPEKGGVVLWNDVPAAKAKLAEIVVSGPPAGSANAAAFEALRKNAALSQEMRSAVSRGEKAPERKLTIGMRMAESGVAAHPGAHAAHRKAIGPHAAPAAAMDHSAHKHSAASAETKPGEEGLEKADTRERDVPWIPSEAKIEWEDGMRQMNERSTSRDITWMLKDASGAENMAVNWKLKKGDLVKVILENPADGMHPMQHPIHFHGQRFLVLAVNGKKIDNLAWKDTVLVGRGDSVTALLEVSNPGKWMAHCHIAEHLTSGMMSGFEVE